MVFNTDNPKDVITMRADGAIVGKRFVTHAGVQSTAGDAAIGVSHYDAADGEEVAVITSGISVITAGGVVAIGDNVASDAVGKAVVATTGNSINGTAMTASAEADDEITIILKAAPVSA